MRVIVGYDTTENGDARWRKKDGTVFLTRRERDWSECAPSWLMASVVWR